MKHCLPILLPFIIVVFIHHHQLVLGQYYGAIPHSVPPTEWKNHPSLPYLNDNIRLVLFVQRSNNDEMSFACGFLCPQSNCNRFLFSIVTSFSNPMTIWSANRNRPVKENATLKFTTDGDLVLHDADGTFVWSTNTSGMGVIKMNLLESGNLVLSNSKSARVWESFNYPTDTLMLGQSLPEGKKLVPNIKASNSSDGFYYLTVIKYDIYAFVGYPPRVYFPANPNVYTSNISGSNSLYFKNGGLFINGTETIETASTTSLQFIKIEANGHLLHYQWSPFLGGWKTEELFGNLDGCEYPMVCGEYGICSQSNQSCNCPNLFVKNTDDKQDNLGCSPVTHLSCELKQDHELLVLRNTSYFEVNDNYLISIWNDPNRITTEEKCKMACLQNCSCKTAYYVQFNDSSGLCDTIPQGFSLISSDKYNYNSSLYIKVVKTKQNSTSLIRKKIIRRKIVGFTSLGVFVFLVILTVIVITIVIRKNKLKEIEEDYITTEKLSSLPRRFYFTQLQEATSNFVNKIGEGGFGPVFAGTIGGEKVAVKSLDSVNQGKQEFLAEIKTIGSIHHINLVRLIGFCADKGQTLLVYEYMPNGSLDKWIFNRTQDDYLELRMRIKIISDVAKGLSYLHEECRQRIAHLDIKPQNILLDDNFNAKVSDFGLAKLIDKDQSHIVTRMKGTPGYLAPEWLTNLITEKVDVYSFGVVIIEVLCGRKNLDYSLPEENAHLISLLQGKIRDDRVLEIIDANIVDMESNVEEIMKIVRLAMWCLESEGWRRPLMSVVVKVLEGAIDLDMERENHFVNAPPVLLRGEFATSLSSALSGEIISGPR